jgi:hypothetical protein
VEPRDSGLVDIARDFLAAYAIAGRVAARYRAGRLEFDELLALVGDDEDAALYRLKERCHALFRSATSTGIAASREALFDLVVGALFHEAMKFRESFYQRAVYGPKMRALRQGAADRDEASLFGEFEKILAATSVRLDESLQETEILLDQTRRQFRRLLAAHRSNGLVTRYLVEHAELVEAVFPEGLDALLCEVHGDAAAGFARAAWSYVGSGHYEHAKHALDAAERRSGPTPELAELRRFADGMAAHAESRHAEALDQLDAWLAAAPAEPDSALADLAWAAVSRVAERPAGGDRALAERARALAERLAPLAPRARRRLSESDAREPAA